MSENYQDLNQDMYKKYYQHSGRSNIIKEIWLNAFGDNFPNEIDHFGFVTNRDLEMFADLLEEHKGTTLLDIGCGKGGPGLRVAEKHDLKLIGIDIVSVAIERANIFKKKFKLNQEAEFTLGSFTEIPLPNASVDHVISIDAFWMVDDKVKALNEVKRVMKDGGKFMFTTWDSLFVDMEPILKDNGFSVISCEETQHWKRYQTQVYGDILKHKNDILDEMGDAGQILISEATSAPPMLEVTERRFYHTQVRK